MSNSIGPRSVPRPVWEPLPRKDCKGVEGRVHLVLPHLVLANLRFEAHASIDEHTAPIEIDVICIAGAGWISIEDEAWPFEQGQTLRWPANKLHRLWTEESSMETLMIEHLDSREG